MVFEPHSFLFGFILGMLLAIRMTNSKWANNSKVIMRQYWNKRFYKVVDITDNSFLELEIHRLTEESEK